MMFGYVPALKCFKKQTKPLVSFHASTFRLVAFCNTEIGTERIERRLVQLLYSTVVTEI